MSQVGLLAEAAFLSDRPVWFGTAAPSAWPGLLAELEGQSADYLAVEVHPEDSPGGYLIFASVPFQAANAPDLAALFRLGEQTRRLSPQEAAGMMLGAAHADGARLVVSNRWGQLVHFGG